MKWFKNKSIIVKLLSGFLVATLISVIVGGVGILNLLNTQSSADQLYRQNAIGLAYNGEAATMFQRVRYNILSLTTITTKEDMDLGLSSATDFITQMDTSLTKLDKVLYSSEARSSFALIKEDWEKYKEAATEVMKHARLLAKTDVLETIEKKLAPIGNTIRNNFLDLSNVVDKDAQSRFDGLVQQVAQSMWIMIGVIMIGVIISVVLALYISRLIAIPIRHMVEASDKLALGDVDIDMNITTKEETGKLAAALKKVIESRKRQVEEMNRLAASDLTVEVQIASEKDVLSKSIHELVNNLNSLVVSIQSSAEQVSAGANQVSNSSMTLSEGASEQASSVEELTASLEEVASKTKQNAQNAQKANELAQHARGEAELGNSHMRDMLRAMDEINTASSSINKIIKVIDDIAFQTNILALNAAVEAARAGQHGKGFAVVAEEVRTLAARSAQAAKETTDLIEGSIRKVEAGTKIANATAEALGKIVTEVAGAADLVESIALASNAQTTAVEQINQGVARVSQVVQHNAATSEESAAASEELSSQAAQLKESISVFKLRKNQGRQKKPAQWLSDEGIIDYQDDEEELLLSQATVNLGKY